MKDAKGHGSDSRGGSGGGGKVRGMPIAGHPYHAKTNDELNYIAKDASAAAQAQRGMPSEGKYLDQVNDASTVLGWRSRGGKDLSQSPATDVAAQHGISTSHLASAPHVVPDSSVSGATHALMSGDKVIGRLYKSGSPAWR
jgi:hypothetical protein